jgi:hypothetical protein
MCSVYQNAVVMLCASAAPGDAAGCFTNSSKQDLVVFGDPDEDHEAIQVRRRLWPEFFYPANEDLELMPLMDRARCIRSAFSRRDSCISVRKS